MNIFVDLLSLFLKANVEIAYNNEPHEIFQFFMAAIIKMFVFWDVASYSLVEIYGRCKISWHHH